ncbi:hypothetical protein [Paracidovorax sp. MALMAid1276]|uniref:hypothetical protein n=1 Tax=Paracidovorax sp. MALMAid1276 TaxID=3411631 RepID=UPI003B9C9277
MLLKRFFDASTMHQRRAQRCLEDARSAALEHETAAEYHAALGKMYRDRALRLERGVCATEEENDLVQAGSAPRRNGTHSGTHGDTHGPGLLARFGLAAAG